MTELFLLDAIGQIDDDLVTEAREPRPVRRRRSRWRGWAAAAACLLLAVGLLLPRERGGGDGGGSSGGGTFPGSVQAPVLWWQGRSFDWAGVGTQPPGPMDAWTPLGQLAGATADPDVREDLWLYADITAQGTVYGNEEYPDALYARMSTGWFEDKWVRFVLPELRFQPILRWQGRLYCAAAHSYPDVKAPRELPEGCVEVGRAVSADGDRIPERDGEITKWYGGSPIWMDPEHPEVVYLQTVWTWAEGSYPIYAPAHAMTAEQAGELTIPPGITLEP